MRAKLTRVEAKNNVLEAKLNERSADVRQGEPYITLLSDGTSGPTVAGKPDGAVLGGEARSMIDVRRGGVPTQAHIRKWSRHKRTSPIGPGTYKRTSASGPGTYKRTSSSGPGTYKRTSASGPGTSTYPQAVPADTECALIIGASEHR